MLVHRRHIEDLRALRCPRHASLLQEDIANDLGRASDLLRASHFTRQEEAQKQRISPVSVFKPKRSSNPVAPQTKKRKISISKLSHTTGIAGCRYVPPPPARRGPHGTRQHTAHASRCNVARAAHVIFRSSARELTPMNEIGAVRTQCSSPAKAQGPIWRP